MIELNTFAHCLCICVSPAMGVSHFCTFYIFSNIFIKDIITLNQRILSLTYSTEIRKKNIGKLAQIKMFVIDKNKITYSFCRIEREEFLAIHQIFENVICFMFYNFNQIKSFIVLKSKLNQHKHVHLFVMSLFGQCVLDFIFRLPLIFPLFPNISFYFVCFAIHSSSRTTK